MTVTSGSKGVLITDTIMFGFFTAITVAVIVVATNKGGGWFHIVETLAVTMPDRLSWAGNPTLGPDPIEKLLQLVTKRLHSRGD